jgi:hypothetical protein
MLKLVERAMMSVMCRPPRVGEFIQKLPKEKRDILKTLRSEDIADARLPFWVA